jgi:hypothetical protein
MSPDRGLGRIPPTDDRHLQKYPLTAASMPRKPHPVVIGINWYDSMDDPVERDGAFWITVGGSVRGGHAVCLESPHIKDNASWWGWYNQGNEGACVAFAISRMMSNLNRRRYAPWELYRLAQMTDEWPGENYSGTSVRAGLDVVATQGMWLPVDGRIDVGKGPVAKEGIEVYRWANDVKDVAACLSPKDNGKVILDQGYVTILNSWGNDPTNGYPHKTRLSLEDLERLVFAENGECAVSTDR